MMMWVSRRDWNELLDRVERLENRGEDHVGIPSDRQGFLFNVKISHAVEALAKHLGLRWTEAGFEPKGKK